MENLFHRNWPIICCWIIMFNMQIACFPLRCFSFTVDLGDVIHQNKLFQIAHLHRLTNDYLSSEWHWIEFHRTCCSIHVHVVWYSSNTFNLKSRAGTKGQINAILHGVPPLYNVCVRPNSKKSETRYFPNFCHFSLNFHKFSSWNMMILCFLWGNWIYMLYARYRFQ
jgi:hypothetical protein